MTELTDVGQSQLPAGDFSKWIIEIQGAIRGDRGSEVPCGSCTACCRSSQFIHIGPEELDTLAHVPQELLFPAPRRPSGHVLMGYDERGHCPMLINDKCSIYEHRPKTCRTYDCRIFPAAGVEIREDEKRAIAERVRLWKFNSPNRSAEIQQEAVRAAAKYLEENLRLLPEAISPRTSTQLALLAIRIHGLFLHRDGETGQTSVVTASDEVVRTLCADFAAPNINHRDPS
jgi:Fe-S-cluster containining protein